MYFAKGTLICPNNSGVEKVLSGRLHRFIKFLVKSPWNAWQGVFRLKLHAKCLELQQILFWFCDMKYFPNVTFLKVNYFVFNKIIRYKQNEQCTIGLRILSFRRKFYIILTSWDKKKAKHFLGHPIQIIMVLILSLF